MSKINMSGSHVGAKALCAVIDANSMEVLPLIATDNGDGTAQLVIDANITGTKGDITTALNGVTVTSTSSEIDCGGYNALLVETLVTVAAKNWTVKVTGCLSTGGTFGDCYDGATLMSYQTNSSRINLWKGIPRYVKIVGTEDEDTGTCTVRVQPIMV